MIKKLFYLLQSKLKKKKAPQGLDEYISSKYIEYILSSSESITLLAEVQSAKDEVSEPEYGSVAMPEPSEKAEIRYRKAKEFKSHKASATFSKPVLDASPSQSADKFSIKLDESFSERLQRLLYEKDMTAPQCYRRAGLDRKLFSKICSSRDYRPKKNTVLSLAIALQLNLDETRDFLEAAGYALSHSILSDVIVEFYISKGFYDIFEINEALFEYDQPLLGS